MTRCLKFRASLPAKFEILRNHTYAREFQATDLT